MNKFNNIPAIDIAAAVYFLVWDTFLHLIPGKDVRKDPENIV